MKQKVICPHCSKLTKLHMYRLFIYKYQICLECRHSYKIDPNKNVEKVIAQ